MPKDWADRIREGATAAVEIVGRVWLFVALGIPVYSNAAGIIPIVQALLEKGAALGKF